MTGLAKQIAAAGAPTGALGPDWRVDRRPLGRTGLDVSVLGMGSSPFRDGDPHTCAELLSQAMALGINYYDTARTYVHGEEVVGLLTPQLREDLIVATKTGARGGTYCVKDLQRSLDAMGRDYVDVWMTHMIETAKDYRQCTALGGFCDIAAAAKRAGMVRATGASFHAPTDMILQAIEDRAFDVVMFQLNIIERETLFGSSVRSYRQQLLPAAQRNGVGLVVMKALAAGELRHGARALEFTVDHENVLDVPGGALRYACLHPAVGVVVVGMHTTDQLARNVVAVRGVGNGLPDVFDEWTARVATITQGQTCARCNRCRHACPQEINIPKVFRLFDQRRVFGMDGVPLASYRELQPDASRCDNCGRCIGVCPEHVDIPEQLAEAHRALSAEQRKRCKLQKE